MARNNGTAHSAAESEAWEIRQGVVASIMERIKAGELTSEDELSDVIHEECDSALIYTSDQWVCAYGLRDERDAFEEGLISEPSNVTEVIAAQAFLNLEDAVNGASDDFTTALQVAEDARLEKEAAKGLCPKCLVPEHDQCGNDADCACCHDSKREG